MAKVKQLRSIDASDAQVCYSLECGWCATEYTLHQDHIGYDPETDFLEEKLAEAFMDAFGFRYARDEVQQGNCCSRCIHEDKDIEVLYDSQMEIGGK